MAGGSISGTGSGGPVGDRPVVARRSLRGRLGQVLIAAAGAALAGLMVVLGFWQLDVYHRSGAAAAARRAAEPAVELSQVARAGSAVRDGYGRTVRFSGTYEPGLQVLLPIPDRPGASRVLAAVRQADGSLLPVVRGIAAGDPLAPPAGPVTETGILLPTEDADSPTTGQPTTVQLPVLAQQWPRPLIDGFVTLSATDATQQGLQPAVVALPEGYGRLRNAAYAVQWWVFAAFTLLMAVRMARESRVGLTSDAVADAGETDEVSDRAT
jgi:surfeit locus 1 family protein